MKRLSATHKQHISDALKGIVWPPEFGAKVSAGLKRYYSTHPHHGIGIPRSKITCQKISKALTGKHLSPNHIAKMRERQKKCCGSLNPFFGKHHSEETKQLLRQKNIGKKRTEEVRLKIKAAVTGRQYSEATREKDRFAKLGNKSRLGIPHTEQTKAKIRASNLANPGLRHSLEFKRRSAIHAQHLWQDPEYIRKQMRSRGIHPNKLELWFGSLLDKLYPNEWKFVGDGQCVIGRKVPDWINTNGQKKIIELFGDYWHKDDNPQDRINAFKEFGFDTLVVWEHELANPVEVSWKLLQFMRM